jgi:KUP system potassium uptake protein
MLTGTEAGAGTAPADVAKRPTAPLVLGAIGIVFGDIGTSPLYTLRECFTGPHGPPLTADNGLGVLSVVFLALMIIVTLKYVTLDHAGRQQRRGRHQWRSPRWYRAVSTTVGTLVAGRPGTFGAAMFYGDG